MKITIDTEEKTIQVHKECNVLELINSLHKLLGDKIQEFKLVIEETIKEEITISTLPDFNEKFVPSHNHIYYGNTAGIMNLDYTFTYGLNGSSYSNGGVYIYPGSNFSINEETGTITTIATSGDTLTISN